jgi:hypothetical protein
MKEHDLKSTDFIIDEIESIELIGELETVDITVHDTHMFYANDVYSHNSGYESDIITGDQVASSFSKIMIGDIIVSLARKTTDKIAGTGRAHFIKNRFGPDGLTLPSKLNMSNGRIEMYQESSVKGQETKVQMDEDVIVRKSLATKYTELLGESLG